MVTPDLVSKEDIAKLIVPDDLPDEQPAFKAYIEAKVYDKEGHLIQYRRQPMRSLTQYFLALMSILIVGTYQSASVTQAPGILTNVLGLPSAISGNSNTATIVWNWSIQLGSGAQSFSPALDSLAAPIANGSGAGQLSYGSGTVGYSGTTIYTYVTVINYSPTTINVTEIGLIGTIYIEGGTGTAGTYTHLLSYDTFSPPITLPPGAIATFEVALSFSG